MIGVFNCRNSDEALTLEIARAALASGPLSLVNCDIKHFERFKADFGHDAGDAVLQTVAAELRSRCRRLSLRRRGVGDHRARYTAGSARSAR
ncbi:diguanylate cyclase [Sphingomonas faeni]|uniref:diguanylate cyclase n=1 Tax=Sphingomonas faeni TaxID=185950 RepID=UPI003354EA95